MKSKLSLLVFVVFSLFGVLISPSVFGYHWGDEEREAVGRVSERDLRSFDNYMDSHWETAQELYRDPELINDRKYVRKHRALKDWLDEHPDAAQAMRANPRAFLWRQRMYQAREERNPLAGVSDRDLRSFDKYLDSHQETAQELYRDPELINDRRYIRNHAALEEWLDDHPDAAQAMRANPRAFLGRKRAYQGSGEYSPTTARISERDLRSFEAYLDSDWQTADQLYREPDLINNRRFVRNHSRLEDWLEDHPDAASAIQANPDRFLWRKRSGGVQDFLNQLLTPQGGR